LATDQSLPFRNKFTKCYNNAAIYYAVVLDQKCISFIDVAKFNQKLSKKEVHKQMKGVGICSHFQAMKKGEMKKVDLNEKGWRPGGDQFLRFCVDVLYRRRLNYIN